MTVEERIAELQKQIDELKAEVKNENGVFNRVPLNDFYYGVTIDRGKAKSTLFYEANDCFDDTRFENNNYFLTEERAKEVTEKINALLKFERIHDMLCPEYKPDWNNKSEEKWFVIDNEIDGNVYHIYNTISKNPVATYFPTDKIDEAVKLYEKMT